jgi:hypothetical protein
VRRGATKNWSIWYFENHVQSGVALEKRQAFDRQSFSHKLRIASQTSE